MVKTTIYLPENLKTRIEQLAVQQGRSEAAVIRHALESYAGALDRPRPTLPLFDSGKTDLAERDEEYLEGFGED